MFRYHLKDVIVGKIYFLVVRIKIKNMELEIRRRESTGSGSNTYVETETLAKFELMDGAPVRGILPASLSSSHTHGFYLNASGSWNGFFLLLICNEEILLKRRRDYKTARSRKKQQRDTGTRAICQMPTRHHGYFKWLLGTSEGKKKPNFFIKS